MKMAYFKDWRERWKARLVPCPSCGAKANAYCVSVRGFVTLFVHYERENIAVKVDEEIEGGLQEADH